MPLNDETLLENKQIPLTDSYEDALKKEDVENEAGQFLQEQPTISTKVTKNIYTSSDGPFCGKPVNEEDENNEPPKAA